MAHPPQRPASAAEPARRSWPRRARRIGLVTVAVLLVMALGFGFWGYLQFRSIERVDLTDVLASGDGTNYLIVGSDTRAGIEADDENAGAILGESTGGERSDTILVLRVTGDGASMLSVPRDLFVTIAETGERQRINAAFNGGPRRLIATLRDQLGLPIHHYLQVDFVSFQGLVDSVGGITIDFPNPAFDTHSGLSVPTAGPVDLDGTQALAFVRSRFYTEVIGGQEVRDPTGDLGRVRRQQVFLSTVLGEVGGTRNPFALAGITRSLVGGLVIDDDLSFLGALGLLRRMRSLDPVTEALPVSNFTTSAGAQVLDLVQPGADEVLARFGSPGASLG